MSPDAVDCASDAPAEAVLEPQDAGWVPVALEGLEGLDAVVVGVELEAEPPPLDPHPATASPIVPARTADDARR